MASVTPVKLLQKLRVCIASSKLLLPMPLLPSSPLILDENSRRARLIFLKLSIESDVSCISDAKLRKKTETPHSGLVTDRSCFNGLSLMPQSTLSVRGHILRMAANARRDRPRSMANELK